MKNKIYNLVIVDESGSMGFLREATLSGINETIGTIRSAQNEFADTQEHFLTLVSFNAIAGHADVRTLINCRPIGEIGEDFSDYHPHGCTPLYDAMGHTVREVAPLFSDCVSLDNVSLPTDFWDVLGLKMDAGH
jgi:hypothetical protein